jgi:hypothetical protein
MHVITVTLMDTDGLVPPHTEAFEILDHLSDMDDEDQPYVVRVRSLADPGDIGIITVGPVEDRE